MSVICDNEECTAHRDRLLEMLKRTLSELHKTVYFQRLPEDIKLWYGHWHNRTMQEEQARIDAERERAIRAANEVARRAQEASEKLREMVKDVKPSDVQKIVDYIENGCREYGYPDW